jgi:hypothetical protein
MSLKIGSNNIGDVYVGGSKISSIFVGNNQVYSSQTLDPDAPRDFIVNVTKQTLDTYISSNESYTNDKYVAVEIATGTESGVTRTATVTYGGITQTVSDVPVNSPTTIRFGKYKGVDDGTPDTGDMTISGDYTYVSFEFTIKISKYQTTQINCVNNIVQYFGNQLTSGCYMGYQTRLTSFVTPTFVTDATISLSYCTNLESIKMSPIQTKTPQILKCTKITSIQIPSTVTKVLYQSFYGCTGLTSITLPSACTTIEAQAFSACTNLTTCNIPNGVTTILDYTFSACGKLNTTIPSSVTSIGKSAFVSCSSLTATLPSTITSIGMTAFSSCTSLPSTLNIPNVTTVGESAFLGCSTITNVVHNSLQTIGNGAFDSCSITSWTVENSCTSIGSGFLRGNPLTSLSVSSGNTTYDSRNNCKAIIQTSNNSIVQGCINTVIPSTVTTIGTGAFAGTTGDYTGLVIPATITSVGQSAFDSITASRIYFAHPSISALTVGIGAFTGGTSGVEYYFKDTEENVTAWGSFTTANFTNTTYHSY